MIFINMKIIITESQYKKVFKEETSNIVSFEDVYRELWSKILNTVCRRYTSDINKARDYCQNGFMKVYKNLHKYDGKGSLEGWVSRVVSNNIKDDIRKNKIDLYGGDYDLSRIEMYDEVYREPNVGEILKVIPMLPPSYRKTFELYYLSGYKLKEIAEMLGVSESTCKTNLMKGRNIIKKYFKENPQIEVY